LGKAQDAPNGHSAWGNGHPPIHSAAREETIMIHAGNMPRFSAILLGVALVALSSCNSGSGGYGSSSGNPIGPGPSMELNSGDFGPGATFQHRFATAGTYAYHCIHHAPMTGSVIVSASATDTEVHVSITSSTAAFPAASVKPGGLVVWTNNTGMIHTVTSN
jgi:plastocyanin